MNIDLETYIVCRVALAAAKLANPSEEKYAKAFNALRQALIDENERELNSTENLITASKRPALVRSQA